MKNNVWIIFLTLLLSSISYAYACSCMMAHPQEHYCTSDFVILARVKKYHIVNSTSSKVYKVRVRKEFKISEKGLVALKSGKLHTPMYDAMCGVDLQPGRLYVLSGNIRSLKAQIYLCNMVMEWNSLTPNQRKGLRLMYKHGCSCKIRNCIYRNHCDHRMKDVCNWKDMKCESNYGICLRQASGNCMWNKNRNLAMCRRGLEPSTNRTVLLEPLRNRIRRPLRIYPH